MDVKQPLFKYFLSLLLLYPLMIASEEVENIYISSSLSHTEGHWLDNYNGYTSLKIFNEVPLLDSPFKTFIDLQGNFFNNGKVAANGGLALRYECSSRSAILGLNGFYDYRETSWNQDFHQVGMGLEYLTPFFDVRMNGYLPVGTKLSHSKTDWFYYEDSYYATSQNQRVAYSGLDIEIGSSLKKFDLSNSLNLYGAIGYYFYKNRKHFPNDYGVKARIEALISEAIRLEFKTGFDNSYHGMAAGTISFEIPLETLFDYCQIGKSSKISTCKNSLYQPIQRQEIIALSKKQCYWTWNWSTPVTPCCDE